MFDQIVSFSNRNVSYKSVIDNLNILDYDYYFKITDSLLQEDVANTLLVFDEILANGFDGNNFINGLASHFRNLLVGKDASTLKLLEVSDGIRQKYLDQSKLSSASFLLSGLNIANQCDLNYKNSKNQRLQVELSLIKICHIPAVLNISASVSAEALKKKPDSTVKTEAEVSPVLTAKSTFVEPIKVATPVPTIVTEKPPTPSISAPIVAEPAPQLIKPKIQSLKSASIIPNLNDLSSPVNTAEEDTPKYVSGDSRKPFTGDEFLKLWNKYAEDIKKTGKINLYTIMNTNAPTVLDDFKIDLVIENRIQEELLMIEKIDLLNFLRVSLENFGIDIITRQSEQTDKKKLYTSQEKYQHMVAKNPKLEEFRRKFNLDVN
jgi:DNA polymerase-3 subunit gamma/tau